MTILNRILQTGKNLASLGSKTAANLIKKAADEIPLQPSEMSLPESAPAEVLTAEAVSSIKQNMLRQASLKGKSLLSNSLRTYRSRHTCWIPSLQFKAVGSGKMVNLKKFTTPAVLFISHKENATTAANLNRKLIEQFFPQEMPFFTANIILLEEIPSFARSIVRRELKKAYDTILHDWLKDPLLAEQWIHILPDWENNAIDSFNIPDQRPALSTVVLGPSGHLQTVIHHPASMDEISRSLAPWVTL